MTAAAMSGGLPPGGARWRDGGLWAAAGLGALALHVAAYAALMAAPPPSPPAGIEEAFAVEMAPELFAPPSDLVSDVPPEITEAVATPAPALTPDQPPAPMTETIQPPVESEAPPDTPDLAEAPPPPELMQPEPPPEPEVIEPEEIPEELPEIAEAQAVLPAQLEPRPAQPRPHTPPEPPREVRETPRREPTRPRREPPPAAAPAAPAAAPAPQIAAPPAGASQATPRQVMRWKDQVNAQVARHMRRWQNPGRAVELRLIVQIDAGGQVVATRLAGSTGDAAIDRSLLSHAQRLRALPPPPAGTAQTLTVPLLLRRS